MSNKEFYINNPPDDLPIFFKPFWLDVVAKNWEVIFIANNKKITACLPYAYDGVDIFTPPFTQHLGPFIIEDNELKNVSKISNQISILEYFINKLPQFKKFEQKWSSVYQNWLPFFWNGFSQTTRYTYAFESPIQIEEVLQGLKHTNRRLLNVAQKRLQIFEDADYKILFGLVEYLFTIKKIDAGFTIEFFSKLFFATQLNNSSKILLAKDEMGNVEAGIFLVWDNKKIYYLLGGMAANIKPNGAMNLLLMEGIKLAAATNKSFDFEGSMVPGIESFFRTFGAELKPYFVITKYNSDRKDYLKTIKTNIKKIIKVHD